MEVRNRKSSLTFLRQLRNITNVIKNIIIKNTNVNIRVLLSRKLYQFKCAFCPGFLRLVFTSDGVGVVRAFPT